MRERTIRIHGGSTYRIEERDDADVAVVLLAFTTDGTLAGKARAVRHRHEPAAALAHLTIPDARRHPALQAALLDELRAVGRRAGIDRLTGVAEPGDTATQQLLAVRGASVWPTPTGGLAFEFPLHRRTAPPAVAERRRLGRLAS